MKEMKPMIDDTRADEEGTMDLVRQAAGDARKLGRLEIELAKDELRADLAAAKSTAMLGGSATLLALMGLSSLLVALGVALGPVVALVVGVVLIGGAGVLAFAGYRALPKPPMIHTLRRLEMDEKILEEHLS
jgi:uncharacterized membrane protein YqjE